MIILWMQKGEGHVAKSTVHISEAKVRPIVEKLKAVAVHLPEVDVILNESVLRAAVNGVVLNPSDIDYLSMIIVKEIIRPFNTGYNTGMVRSFLDEILGGPQVWVGRNRVYEKDGIIYVEKNKKEHIPISNFILKPEYTVTVMEGHKYHVYTVKIVGDPKEYKLTLRAEHFNKLESLQSEIAKQLMGTSARINGCSSYMNDLGYKYIDIAKFEKNIQGTSLLGLERFEDKGPKYFCTPNGIYSVETGDICEDIMYMGNEEANMEEIRTLTNLEYDKKKWPTIAKTFLSNVVHINDKKNMMKLVGWMGAIPHDYVIRKVVGTGYFPHCHIVGEPGAGKTTIMTILKQFMGHNDSAPRTFSTPFELSKLLNSSYTIPAVLDEYGKRWDQDRMNKINTILVEAFTKSRWSRGTASQDSIYYKYKNPLLFGGQIPTNDQALASRTVVVRMNKSFHETEEGKKAQKHKDVLQKMKDKNFWVGYCIWCAEFSNDEVKKTFEKYRTICRRIAPDERVADIQATVMLGLYFLKRLAESIGTDIGYKYEEIEHIYDNDQDTDADEIENPIEQFLQDIATYARAYGNHHNLGRWFGHGEAVSMRGETNDTTFKKYGKGDKYESCIMGQKLLLVNVEKVCNSIRYFYKYNAKELETFIFSDFERSKKDPLNENNLVLAPKSCRIQNARYTAFNWKRVVELVTEFEELEDLLSQGKNSDGSSTAGKNTKKNSK